MGIHVDILTPEWNRAIDAEAVFLPGAMGEFEVLPNHAPIISTLTAGAVRWRAGGSEESLRVKGGAVRLENNIMQICVEVI